MVGGGHVFTQVFDNQSGGGGGWEDFLITQLLHYEPLLSHACEQRIDLCTRNKVLPSCLPLLMCKNELLELLSVPQRNCAFVLLLCRVWRVCIKVQ